MQIESDAGAEFGRWSVDGHPRSIEFPGPFWKEILSPVMAEFLRLPWGGPEVGGVLFGRREPGAVRILAFRPLECEHAGGPGFELSEDDELRLGEILAKPGTDEELAGLEAVGWYHSKHDWLVLNDRDVKLYDRYFAKPWQIAMVFLRRRSQPCMLGFFFRREDGSIASAHREFSVREAAPPSEPEPAAEAAPEAQEIAPPRTFCAFWGIREMPCFDPAARYWSSECEEVLSKVIRAVSGRMGLIVVTGEAGVGKTTLLERLGDYLTEESMEFALLKDPRLSAEEFHEFLAYDLDLPCSRNSKVAVLTALRELLIRQAGRGSTGALLIDDADRLEWEVLEEIRMLDNLQHRTGRLLQTVLCGSPEFDRRLDSDELHQLRGRVAVRLHLRPPSEAETGQWIERELSDCGMPDQTVFTPEILSAIHARSGGSLRVAGAICDGLLATCYARGSRVATVEMLEALWAEEQAGIYNPGEFGIE